MVDHDDVLWISLFLYEFHHFQWLLMVSMSCVMVMIKINRFLYHCLRFSIANQQNFILTSAFCMISRRSTRFSLSRHRKPAPHANTRSNQQLSKIEVFSGAGCRYARMRASALLLKELVDELRRLVLLGTFCSARERPLPLKSYLCCFHKYPATLSYDHK